MADSGAAGLNATQPAEATAGDTHSAQRLLLIIPCFNEENSIGPLLQEIAATCRYDTIVVDDGSSDSTSTVARRYSPTLRLAANLGIGGAVQTGIKYAQRGNYDFCVQIDGDGQHDPRMVADLLRSYESHPHNIVVGSRYLAKSNYRSTLIRRLGGKIISRTLALVGGQRIADPTSGMRLMDRKAIALFARRYPHDYPEPISLAWGMRAGLTVSEVPVEMRPRESGSSTINGLRPLIYMIRVVSYVLLSRLTRQL